jgi:uncharacterized membrane protein YgcG
VKKILAMTVVACGLALATDPNCYKIEAAEPTSPAPAKLITLPSGRILTPWDQHMLQVYRIVDVSRLESLEFGGGDGGAGGGDGGAGAGSGGDSGGNGGCK